MFSAYWTIFQDTLMLGLGFIGLAVYVVVLVVLIKYSKTTFKRPFFTFCISLGFVELIGLIKPIIDPVLVSYMTQNKDDYLFQRLYGALSRLPWFAVLYHQLFMALERMTSLLYPKLHDKMWTTRMMCIHYTIITALTLASNLCIATKTCEYVLYPDGVTDFYNMSNPGSALHNKIVDLGIQPFFILTIICLYLMTGIKIIRIRRQIRQNQSTKTDAAIKKRRIEIMLVLQGFLISAPQTITAAIYHLIIYLTLAGTLKLTLNFFLSLASKLVFVSSPFLYLALNTDVRVKVAALLTGDHTTLSGVSMPAVSVMSPVIKLQAVRKAN